MRRRFCILLILCLVAAAGGLIWFALTSGSTDDPIYHGRRLSRWLDDAYGTNDPDAKAAQEACEKIGTNAFPCLLSWATATDSPAKHKLLDWLDRHHVSGIHIPSAEDRHNEATAGFYFLGAKAKPVIPALSMLLNNTNSSRVAALILAGLGPDGFAPLTNALTNVNSRIQQSALVGMTLLGQFLLRDKSPTDPAKADSVVKEIVSICVRSLSDTNAWVRRWGAHSLGYVAPEPTIVVPALIRALSDTDAEVREYAGWSLGKLGTNAIPAVPALVHELSDTDEIGSGAAAEVLENLGTNANPAAPALIPLLTNETPYVRLHASRALKAIDPAAAAQAGVK